MCWCGALNAGAGASRRTKDELLSALKTEVRILLHLAGKAGPEQLEYRPTPNQRSTLELLRYLAIMGPIHLRGVLADSWDMASWGAAWQAGEAAVKNMGAEEAAAEIGK